MIALLIDETIRNVPYMNEAIEFVSKYVQGQFVLFEPYGAYPKLQQYNARTQVAKKLLKLRLLKICDRNITKPISNKQYEIFQFSEQYIGEITYLQSNGDTVIIFCDPARFKTNAKEICGVFFINHYAEELNSKISNWISDGRFDLIKESKIIVPTTDCPLPNKDLCSRYKQVLDELSRGKTDKKPDYIAVASEVARRNMYCEDLEVQAKNKGGMRKIFSCNRSGTQYVSIDMEKGTLEAHNKKGKHLGEYNYYGVQTASPDKTGKHDIIV